MASRRLPHAVIEREVLGLPVVQRGVQEITDEVATEARQLAYERAFDEGTYAALIDVMPATDPIGGRRIVRARDRKSKWLEEGTGVYGPTRRPIKPKRGKFLVFRIPAGAGGQGRPAPKGSMSGSRTAGDLVFARSVKGRDASWVMRDAAMRVASRRGLRFTNRRAFQG